MKSARLAKAFYDFYYYDDQEVKRKLFLLAEALLARPGKPQEVWQKKQIQNAVRQLRTLPYVPVEDVRQACGIILNLARLTGKSVAMVFNGVRVTARPDSNVRGLVNGYYKKL